MSDPTFAHYRMTEAGDMEKAPAATDGTCISYLTEVDGRHKLCVIEGGVFHNFNISVLCVAGLADQSTRMLRSHLTRPQK